MTHDRYLALVRQPDLVIADDIPDLRNIVEAYPYLVSARILLSKALKNTGSIHFSHTAKQTSLYVFDRRWFYFFLNPEKLQSEEKPRAIKSSSGDYFEMLETVEKQGGDTKQSFRELAEKLKEARKKTVDSELSRAIGTQNENSAKSVSEMPSVTAKTSEPNQQTEQMQSSENEIDKEALSKKYIREKKYSEAIELLKELNLNNPKKSTYFADQIRFLEKIVENSKK